jgi:CRP/FNR family transcriptional regulator
MSRLAQSKEVDYGNNFNSGPDSDYSEGWKEFESPSQTYPTGVELFLQGSPAQEVFCIDSGVVKLHRLESDGQELIVDLRFPDWLMGAAAVIVQEPYPVTAVTITPCRLRRMPASVFRYLVKSDVQLSWRLHRMHSRKVFDQVTRITQLACLSARHRIEYFFTQLISALGLKQQKDIRLPLPLKNSEMAALVAVTPEYFSRMLKEMQSEKVIRIGKGQLTISDARKLWRPL